MSAIPVAIEREGPNIWITWSDEVRCSYSPRMLRKACPCALCKEKRSQPTTSTQPFALPVITQAEAQPLSIDRMQPVGNYAYNIHFSDGHNAGIFEFQMLRDLGDNPQ